jgi:hypothetical protein
MCIAGKSFFFFSFAFAFLPGYLSSCSLPCTGKETRSATETTTGDGRFFFAGQSRMRKWPDHQELHRFGLSGTLIATPRIHAMQPLLAPLVALDASGAAWLV